MSYKAYKFKTGDRVEIVVSDVPDPIHVGETGTIMNIGYDHLACPYEIKLDSGKTRRFSRRELKPVTETQPSIDWKGYGGCTTVPIDDIYDNPRYTQGNEIQHQQDKVLKTKPIEVKPVNKWKVGKCDNCGGDLEVYSSGWKYCRVCGNKQ